MCLDSDGKSGEWSLYWTARGRPVPCSRVPVLAGWADLDERETAADIQERHPILIDPQFRIDPVLVTASDLEERREEERAEKIRAYCAEHGLSYERLPLFGSDRALPWDPKNRVPRRWRVPIVAGRGLRWWTGGGGLGGRCTGVLARRPPSPAAYGPSEAVN